MSRFARLATALLLCLPAAAQVGEISVSLGQSRFSNADLGKNTAGNSFAIKDGFRFAFRFTLNTQRHFGHELGYAYNRSGLKRTNPAGDVSMTVHSVMYNFLAYATKEGRTLRPFVTGGAHLSTFYPPGTSVYNGTGVTRVGVNYGGGIKIKINPLFNLRFDVREYMTGKPFDLIERKGLLRQMTYSAGLGLIF